MKRGIYNTLWRMAVVVAAIVLLPGHCMAQEEAGIDLSKPDTWEKTIEHANVGRGAIFDRLAEYALGRGEFGRTDLYEKNDNTLDREKAFDLLLKVDFRRAIAFYLENIDSEETFLHFPISNAETEDRATPCIRLLASNYWDALPDIVRHLASRNLTDGGAQTFRCLMQIDAPAGGRSEARLGLPRVVDRNVYYGLPASALKFFEQYHGEHSPYRNNLRRILRPFDEGAQAPAGDHLGTLGNESNPKERGAAARPGDDAAHSLGPDAPAPAGGQIPSPVTPADKEARRDTAHEGLLSSLGASNVGNDWITPFIAGAAGLLTGFLLRGWLRR